MGRKKLLKRLGEFFSMDQRARARRQDELADILERLSRKEAELQQQLAQETDEQKRRNLSAKIEVIRQQWQKGRDMLSGLQQEDD